MNIRGNEIMLLKHLSFNPKTALFLLIFLISFLMMVYLMIDFLFGFSVRYSLKNCKPFNKMKGYDFLEDIYEELKFKFSCPNLKLYIKHSDEINAYAIGGMGRRVVVLTTGLINHYSKCIADNQKFLIAIRSILGHEMSHLINKDFLPGLLIMVNNQATSLMASIILVFFRLYLRISEKLDVANTRLGMVMMSIYSAANSILWCFNKLIISNCYEFLKRFFSRSVEYRCDRQSAKAFGGINMAYALSFLGKSGYITLFSTHPATQRRIRKVEVVEEKNAIIRSSIMSDLSNFMSLMVIPLMCYYAAVASHADVVIKYYLYKYYPNFYYHAANLCNMMHFVFQQIIAKINLLIQSAK